MEETRLAMKLANRYSRVPYAVLPTLINLEILDNKSFKKFEGKTG